MGSASPAALPHLQPPPDRHRCNNCFLMDGVVDHHSNTRSKNKKEGYTLMVGGNRRAYYFRRCKKVRATSIESLPHDLLRKILVRVSAGDICENAKAVCRDWYNIIHSDGFASAHLHHHRASCGLFLEFNHHSDPVFLAMRQGRIEISRMSYPKCKRSLPASCNGLVLWRESSLMYLGVLYIVNPATKQTLSLPSSPSPRYMTRSGIAYAAASMEYKVVRIQFRPFGSALKECHILTAGVDSNWRCVGIDNLSDGAKSLLFQRPMISEGFMHWTCWSTQVLTFNVETETFKESYVPLHQEVDMYYLSTGRRLSLLNARGDWVWEVWEMEAESGEWRKMLPNIDLESQKGRVEEFAYQYCKFLRPLGWIKYPVLLALCFSSGQSRTCFLYNLDTHEIDPIQLPLPCRNYKVVVHTNTLEWFC